MRDAKLLCWLLCVPRDVRQSWLRKGMAPALPCTVWCEVCLQGASEAREVPFCLSFSFGNHQQLPEAMQPLPAASYSLLSPAPIHPDSVFPCCCSSLCSSVCASLSLGYGERSWAYLFSSAHTPAEWHPELGPSCSLLLCANSHSCWLFEEKKTDLDHAAWAQVLGNFPKVGHNGQVLAKSHTFPFSQFTCNKWPFPLKDFGANSAYSVSRSNWEWIKYSGHEKQAKRGQWSRRCICGHLPSKDLTEAMNSPLDAVAPGRKRKKPVLVFFWNLTLKNAVHWNTKG